MAKKQSRRTVSLNRIDYEAAKIEAARRGMSLAALVEAGLAAIGVPVIAHVQQPLEVVQGLADRRAARIAKGVQKLPSRERQLLGDQVADACGFQ